MWFGQVWFGWSGRAGSGTVWFGLARLVRSGMAGSGEARQGKVGLVWRGMVGHGSVRFGWWGYKKEILWQISIEQQRERGSATKTRR